MLLFGLKLARNRYKPLMSFLINSKETSVVELEQNLGLYLVVDLRFIFYVLVCCI